MSFYNKIDRSVHTLKEQLEKVIRFVDDSHLIERLMAEKSNAERIKLCNEVGGSKEFEEFNKTYAIEMKKHQQNDEFYVFSENSRIPTPKNATQIALICIIAGIDDCDLFEDWEELESALREVQGEYRRLAKNILKIIGTHDGEECSMFSEYEMKNILSIIF